MRSRSISYFETTSKNYLSVLLGLILVFSIYGCQTHEGGERIAAEEQETSSNAAAEYVGDEACGSCHGDIFVSYHRTGMGRSVSRFDPATAPEQFGDGVHVYNQRFDLYYEPIMRGDSLYQREYRLDAAGNVIYEQTHAADWVIGSGNNTRSYIMETGGTLTEMPLTWYVEREKWDMSPGYDVSNSRFSRPISLECMTCHNGLPEHTPFTQATYSEVPLGITCERCHGPGGDHVEARLSGLDGEVGKADATIVNPARLDRTRQLAVCQQCHLTGTSVFAPGEDPTTFRPGELLSAHRSVFIPEAQIDDPEAFGIASHAQRLALSACYQQSEMTCTTCHDPHRPVAELEADHFNQQCLACHNALAEEAPGGEALCSRHGVDTAAEAMTGNCISCHLQRSGTSDIPHVTFTDHWIRRTVPASRAPSEGSERLTAQREPFKLVRAEERAATGTEAQALLEEAIAYFNFYETMHPLPDYLPRVVTLAQQGFEAGGEHVEARIALGRALVELDSLTAAEVALEAAVAQNPDHAHAHYWLGTVRQRAGNYSGAVRALERAVDLQPAFVEAQFKLAATLDAAGRTAEAESVYLAALDRAPIHHPDAWNDLGFLYLKANRVAEAADMFEQAIQLDPDFAIALVNLGTTRMMNPEAPDLEAAAAYFQRAARADSSYVAAFGNLGLVLAQQGRYREARPALERVLELEPGNTRARAALRQVEQLIEQGE